MVGAGEGEATKAAAGPTATPAATPGGQDAAKAGQGPVAWPIAIEVKVPWRDIDVAGHVNNAIYFSYMETARVEAYLAMLGKNNPEDLDLIVARAACDFHSPAYMGETLVVKVWPSRVGNTSFTLRYELREKGSERLVAQGETVQVMYDYAKKTKKPIPPPLRKLLDG